MPIIHYDGLRDDNITWTPAQIGISHFRFDFYPGEPREIEAIETKKRVKPQAKFAGRSPWKRRKKR